jgi:UDP-N-acetylmuramate dehydrogenase
VEELASLLGALGRRGVRPFILGKGANTIFPDGEYPRPVISTRALAGHRVEGETLRAECGVPLPSLIRIAMSRRLAGLEGFTGIPGTVGGAFAMNAGGAGWSFGERVLEAGVIPLGGGPVQVLRGSEVPWRYRSSGLEGVVVAWVRLGLEAGSPERMKDTARDFLRRKAETQPLNLRSAGCIFKNPIGGSAGRWIDALGLKGLSVGGACVSERHANFIVNSTGRATARDVLDLVALVRQRVQAAYGVVLETEVVVA